MNFRVQKILHRNRLRFIGKRLLFANLSSRLSRLKDAQSESQYLKIRLAATLTVSFSQYSHP